MPRITYRTADGKRVPSVTTVLGKFKDPGALMWWAWNEGMEGRDFRQTRDDAASAGSVAHEMVEAHLCNRAPDLNGFSGEILEKGNYAFQNFLRWAEGSKLEIVATETSLVSEDLRTGGTPDAIGLVNDELCVLDWKTSKNVYAEYLCQVAAYGYLWEENNPKDLITGGYHIIRFDRDEGDFAHSYFRDLADGLEMFKHLRAAYDLVANLKKRT